MILPSLAAKMREIEEYSQIKRSEMAMIVLGTSCDKEMERVREWMRGQFPEVNIRMDNELVGSEMPVVFSIGNFNKDTIRTMVSAKII